MRWRRMRRRVRSGKDLSMSSWSGFGRSGCDECGPHGGVRGSAHRSGNRGGRDR